MEKEEIILQNEDELFKLKEHSSLETEHIDAPKYSYWRSVFRVFFKKKSNYVVLGILIIVLLLSFIQPLFSGYDLSKASDTILKPETHFLPPSWQHWFGTDSTGAEMWDVVWAGAQTSLLLAIVCALINMTVGIIVGAIWGYSKKFDKVMMEIYNIVANVPFILVILIVVYIIGSGFWQLVFAMCITGWLGIAFFLRTQVIIIRDREYNLASRCLGTPLPRMVSKNIMPYLTSVIVTLLAGEIPGYISYEVYLSYLGIGLSGFTPSLGRTIDMHKQYMVTPTIVEASGKISSYWHTFWIPVVVAAVITVTLYLVGQNLADASDPRTHM